jgi:peptidylprolyl isomerase
MALGSVLLAGCSSDPAPGGAPSTATVASMSASSSAPAVVGLAGLTLSGASDLTAKPKVTARSAAAPATLRVRDVVAGSGAAATPASTVTVQYVGVRYADGRQFVASWDHGGATSFSLRSALPGLARGIGGGAGTEPMRVGGRRIVLVPPALGYGRAGTPDRSIGPNASLAFVVDLLAVS